MQIALISDTHLTPFEPAFDANLLAAKRWISTQAIDLTIHLGDITADGAVRSDELGYAAAQLADWPSPLRMIPGNHDIGDNPGETAKTLVSPQRLDRYEAAFGWSYWMQQTAGWTLIGLNAQLLGRCDTLEAEQATWLEALLPSITGPVGLFLHKPLFREGPADTSRHHRYVPVAARDDLLRRLAAIDLRFVASGHTHQSRKLHIGGVEHVWVPSTAFVLPDVAQERIGEKETAMMLLTLTADAYDFALVHPAGMVEHDLLDHVHVYPDQAAALRALGGR
ncbi:metallophosphoesterase [Sphingomonas sp.]|uniref:metallophosphoesterase family protein n=2 Tax=Pseudomonadota TaxID=1224 RepID=UPI001ACEB1F4|nr:metallophosphoesterase [Sphingomonas sp.]MBN8816305.1 metallophosphoesterase [Sphingomonas sp.]